MRKLILLIGCLVVMLPSVFAESVIRPGLWEVTTKSDLLGLVPHVPAEQMQQITHLAKQYGLEMPQINNGMASSKMCITPEMAKQEVPSYLFENQMGCAVKNASRTGNRYQMELTCNNAQFKGNGYAEGVFITPESFSGQAEFDSVVQGSPIVAHAETSGRWVGEHCDVVTPIR